MIIQASSGFWTPFWHVAESPRHLKIRIRRIARLQRKLYNLSLENQFIEMAGGSLVQLQCHCLEKIMAESFWFYDWIDEMENDNESWSFQYDHPLLGSVVFGDLIQEEGSADPSSDPKRAIAESLFKTYAGWLVSDIQAAKGLGLPVGTLFDHHAVKIL